MKVLIVGSNQVWAIENYFNKYLNEAGVDTQIFSCSDQYNATSLANRIMLRMHMTSMFKKVNDALIAQCEHIKPDVVWVFKGIEIYKETLQRIRQMGIRLVNYNPDHPFIRTSISHGGKSIAESVALYDMHFCYSQALRSQIENEYRIKANLLPFAYEPSALHNEDIQSEDMLRIAMVGHADSNRASIIRRLLKAGFAVDVFGPKWNRYFKPAENLEIYPPVFGVEFWKTLLNYRVQLNIFRPHNEGSHNMRTFEIPSIGGIQLAPWSREHADYFEPDKEIWLYADMDELITKAKQLLEMPSSIIATHRALAKARCIAEDHTYRARANHAATCMESLLIGM